MNRSKPSWGGGLKETVNTAEEGDLIVTNPGGEEYVLKSDNFGKRYEATEEEGIFRAKGMARAFQNPTGGDIKIMAPWGEEQFGNAACMIATVYDPEQLNVIGPDRYIIGHEEFLATYAPVEQAPIDRQ
ncbi:MAG TPA: PGDYG domain-containing protein [Verrucomicrobiae bacterium]|nr:PGDYG domain-containing protein [Verrucomicrobiae bacterium]